MVAVTMRLLSNLNFPKKIWSSAYEEQADISINKVINVDCGALR